MRIRSIDVFRGLAIVLMVLFTLMLKLSGQIAFFDHNTPGEMHAGDFVLPLFLFASGMSLVFFVEKRRDQKRIIFYLDTIGRFGRLFMIGMLLSLFSTGVFFAMDEVALSAILFLITVALMRFQGSVFLAISALLAALYYMLHMLGLTTIFDGIALGGYQGAVFYLPVMLAGAYLGKGILHNRFRQSALALLVVSIVALLALIQLFPIDKMRVSPSFMAASVLIGTLIFFVIQTIVETFKLTVPLLEYLGKKPIRYWVLMFVLFVIPYVLCVSVESCDYPMEYPLLPGLLICGIFMGLFAVVAGLLDRIGLIMRALQGRKGS